MIERRKLAPNYHSLEYGGIAAPMPLLVWPAYMALPFLRAPLGYRLVTPWQVAWCGGGLLCLQIVIDGEAGYSWLAWYTPLPVSLTEIFIVPGVVGLAGWKMATTMDAELGVWLMMIGASLFWMAVWEYRRSAALRRAIADDLVHAGAYEHHIGGAAGVPTGGKSDRSDGGDYADLG